MLLVAVLTQRSHKPMGWSPTSNTDGNTVHVGRTQGHQVAPMTRLHKQRSVGSRIDHTKGEGVEHQLEPSDGEQRRRIRERRETVGTYYYLHAVRAVKPGEQRPKEHFQRVG